MSTAPCPSHPVSRRALLAAAAVIPIAGRGAHAQPAATPAFGYPLALPDRAPGDGFIIRHGYACENTWYLPGDRHTGEDWYRLDGAETGGVRVVAIADGEVVFVGSDYPGRVVIVRHDAALVSMYGHLAYEPAVREGERVTIGQTLGVVLSQVAAPAPSHLHLEVRTFLTTADVNGDTPRYNYACGPNCAPGPGYWPIFAPDHPSEQGWRNPVHAIAAGMFPGGTPPTGSMVVVAAGAPRVAALWSAPPGIVASGTTGGPKEDPGDAGAAPVQIGELALRRGERYPWQALAAGRAASKGTSSASYRLWYQVETPAGDLAWLQAVLPDDGDTGGDGRPASVRLVLVPA